MLHKKVIANLMTTAMQNLLYSDKTQSFSVSWTIRSNTVKYFQFWSEGCNISEL